MNIPKTMAKLGENRVSVVWQRLYLAQLIRIGLRISFCFRLQQLHAVSRSKSFVTNGFDFSQGWIWLIRSLVD